MSSAVPRTPLAVGCPQRLPPQSPGIRYFSPFKFPALCRLPPPFWGFLLFVWKSAFLGALNSPTATCPVLLIPYGTSQVTSIKPVANSPSWPGFPPEKTQEPNQNHSTLKTLINPHHGSWLHKANKSHGPIFMFGEIRVIGI